MTIKAKRGVALVTGASSGIGHAAAEEFLRRGYTTAPWTWTGPQARRPKRHSGSSANAPCSLRHHR